MNQTTRSNSSNSNSSNNKLLNDPLYRSFSIHSSQYQLQQQQEHQSIQAISNKSQSSNSLLSSSESKPLVLSPLSVSISQSSTSSCGSEVKQAASSPSTPAAGSKIIVNDYFLSFDGINHSSPYSIQIKSDVKVEDVAISISNSLGGVIEYHRGRINASLKDVTLSVSICRDMMSGTKYLEFNRSDGCPFTFAYLFHKSVLESSSLLVVDADEIKKKYQSSETKLKMWNAGSNPNNNSTISEDNTIIQPLQPLLNQA